MAICEICGNENDGSYGSGRFCSLGCARKTGSASKERMLEIGQIRIKESSDRREEYLKNPNKCLNCGEIIELKEDDSLSNIKKKKFCNRSCSAVYNNIQRGYVSKKLNEKYCLNCGAKIKKNVASFCSMTCHQEYTLKSKLENYNNKIWDGSTKSGFLSTTIENYIRDFYNHKCQLCGWCKKHSVTKKAPLEIHHKDGNSLNHSFDNLQLLCPNCHSLTDNFRNLNGSSNRKYRNKK